MEDQKNKDFKLLIKCMSDDRLVIPNMIIFSRKSYLEKFFFNNDLNKNIIMAINNTRYNNDELSLY